LRLASPDERREKRKSGLWSTNEFIPPCFLYRVEYLYKGFFSLRVRVRVRVYRVEYPYKGFFSLTLLPRNRTELSVKRNERYLALINLPVRIRRMVRVSVRVKVRVRFRVGFRDLLSLTISEMNSNASAFFPWPTSQFR